MVRSSGRCLVRHHLDDRQASGAVAKSRDETMIEERDISVAMRDGTRLAVDVYRPDTAGSYPVLYASALHNKDIQGPDIADILPPQPAHAPLWFGPIEAGDTRRFIANGYVHVIAQPTPTTTT
jgi:predicted acyl esterase